MTATDSAPEATGPDATSTDPAGRGWLAGQTLSSGHRLFWWAEVALVLGLYVVYEFIRNASSSGAAEALANARRITDLQGVLGLNQELAWQEWALDHEPVVVAANYFYGAAYIVVTVWALVWLYRRFPDSYPLWRTTLVVGTMLALVGFALFPLMPPRLLDLNDTVSWGFVDTMARYPTLWSFQSEAMSRISNQFAAMPSLHCGWAMWVCAALLPHLRVWWSKALAVAYPLVTIAVVVVTGNHFFLDAAGGAIVMAAGYGVAMLTTRAGRRPARAMRTGARPAISGQPSG